MFALHLPGSVSSTGSSSSKILNNNRIVNKTYLDKF